MTTTSASLLRDLKLAKSALTTANHAELLLRCKQIKTESTTEKPNHLESCLCDRLAKASICASGELRESVGTIAMQLSWLEARLHRLEGDRPGICEDLARSSTKATAPSTSRTTSRLRFGLRLLGLFDARSNMDP